MASLGNLVASVAHEVNTPIGICVTAASSLTDTTKNIRIKFRENKVTKSIIDNYLDHVEELSSVLITNLDRTTEIVSSFKLVSLDQADESPRNFFIKEYITEVLCSLSVRLDGSDVKVIFDDSNDFQVCCFTNAIFKILTNLVTNSLVHSFAHKPGGIIEILIKKENDSVNITYKDNGIGVSQENLSQLFEPFFTTNRGHGSNGLGLHIVYNTTHQMLNGTITCQSELGEGIHFDITFPIRI